MMLQPQHWRLSPKEMKKVSWCGALGRELGRAVRVGDVVSSLYGYDAIHSLYTYRRILPGVTCEPKRLLNPNSTQKDSYREDQQTDRSSDVTPLL